MIIDNVSDFTHAYLHRKYRPFSDAKLTQLETVGDKVYARPTTPRSGTGEISRPASSTASEIDTNAMDLCYEYPYQWSNTDGQDQALVLRAADRRAHHARLLPVLLRRSSRCRSCRCTSRGALMNLVLALANVLHIEPLLAEDGVAVEAEQEGYEAHFDAPIAELNPAVRLFQQLTIRKWEEHLAKQQGDAAEPAADRSLARSATLRR